MSVCLCDGVCICVYFYTWVCVFTCVCASADFNCNVFIVNIFNRHLKHGYHQVQVNRYVNIPCTRRVYR